MNFSIQIIIVFTTDNIIHLLSGDTLKAAQTLKTLALRTPVNRRKIFTEFSEN